ncbi:hypothetical protein [Alkalibacillus haloalkaliphilus]|uniref:Uncharacterized protein n=1 Tax=Alkalibacillus haloalkaliphilus TaxID=94136 RepID=A0A511W2R8_9BACI|nr:hypothetical protein [Alkalibacillus haloalkaliphilus]GEN45061.1 hypothetical protein AHA02nite_08370 [Alkalibacillus haloalkaliphilus]
MITKLGVAFTTVNIEPDTPPTQVTITATTTVDGEDLGETIVLTVGCEDRNCAITIEAPALITCEGEITGTVTCDGIAVEDAVVEFNNFPIVGEFNPNPATTDGSGNYSTTLTVPESTPLISTVIMATTTVNGETITAMVSLHIECPLEECPCKYRIGIQGNAAPATVNVTQQSTPTTFQGTINVTAIQCFTASAMCNPAINNFNISFGSGGNTINFVMGRRINIACDGNNFARVHGVANATGNVFNGIFDVLIELQISPSNIGTWTIIASDLHGNTFSTTFSAIVSPATFIGDCSDVP